MFLVTALRNCLPDLHARIYFLFLSAAILLVISTPPSDEPTSPIISPPDAPEQHEE